MFKSARTVECNALLLLTLAIFFSLSIVGNLYQGYLLLRSNTPVVSFNACPCAGSTLHEQHGSDPVVWTAQLQPEPLGGSIVENRFLASSGSSTSSSSSASSASSAVHHSGNHPHDALIFLFNAILIGTAVLHLSSLYPTIQLTVALFVLGVVISLVLEGLEVKDSIGIFGQSYLMWMDIDPHLLLFTMLPTLLAGDAMSIDTSVAKRVFLQCLYLAGPGVVVSAMAVAGFLCFYFNWDFLTSLVVGAILCATDPVAVVALLKELSASPLLTTQIQGESLLNDGTAIVLYTVAYQMLCGKEYDVNDMAMFMVKTAMMAVALGVFLGYVFFSWVRAAGNRFNHHSSVIQILLTLSAAYWSFIMAEGVFKMSGVLACVGSSIVLAHHMWPHVVHHHTVQHFWHTLEEIGNIIIFLLGGALTGSAMVNIKMADYFHLLVIYVFLLVLRFIVIFGSRPLLKNLNQDKLPVSTADAAVMVWGGLRGSIGLALAIQVQRGRAPNSEGVPQIDKNTADRVLFFVSGIAFLTTIVNATTTPTLVKWLGITAMPRAQEALLQRFNNQLVQLSLGQEHPQEVTDCLRRMVAHIEHDISAATKSIIPGMAEDRSAGPVLKSSDHVIDAYKGALLIYNSIPDTDKQRLDNLPKEMLPTESMQILCDWLKRKEAEEEMCKVVNKTFMSMVQNNYFRQIEHGDLRPGSPETDVLLTSIRVCLSPLTTELADFEFVIESVHMRSDTDLGDIEEHKCLPEKMQQSYKRLGKSRRYESLKSTRISKHLVLEAQQAEWQKTLHAIVSTAWFHWGIVAMIMANTIYVVIEEAIRKPSNETDLIWLVIECFFTAIFLVECVMKLVDKGRKYFSSGWNCFDFLLVVLGIFGIVMSIISIQAVGAAAEGSAESRVIRISRVLRTMRLMRIFRLFHARLSADKFVSSELATCMHQMQTLMCFVQAHESAQEDLVKYFSGSLPKAYNDMEAAIARCILQSQASVYKALICIVHVQRSMDSNLLDEFRFTKERKGIVEELEDFVESAQSKGAITAKEAEAILHPMHEEISSCLQVIARRTDGVVTKDLHLKSTQQKTKTFDWDFFQGSHEADNKQQDQPRMSAGAPYTPQRMSAGDALTFQQINSQSFDVRGSFQPMGQQSSQTSWSVSGSSQGGQSLSILRDADPTRVPAGVPDHSKTNRTLARAVSFAQDHGALPAPIENRCEQEDPSKSLLRGVPKASFQPSTAPSSPPYPVKAESVLAPIEEPSHYQKNLSIMSMREDSAVAPNLTNENLPTHTLPRQGSEATSRPGNTRKIIKKRKKKAPSAGMSEDSSLTRTIGAGRCSVLFQEYPIQESLEELEPDEEDA